MSDVMINASDLSKRFGSFRAVDKINFEVRKGEVVGFLGPNGAGKSTTMRILTCFISPTAGSATINGYDIFDDSLGVRGSLGYLPQRAPLYLEMSVLEYLRFAGDLRQLDPDTFKRRARNVVEVCGLARVLGKEIRHLSHGYRQRVGLAQALIHDPPILILDEPTSDLDPNEKAEFLEYLKQIGEERTVLLSTHNLSEVEAACARAIIISKGRIVADGPLDEIRAKSGRVRYVVTIQETAGSNYRGNGSPPTKGEVEHVLNQMKGVSKITELPTDERAHTYEVASAEDVDLRPDLFRLVADKGWVMLELHRDAQTLEDVFRQLTLGDEKRNRKLDVSDEDEEESEEEEESAEESEEEEAEEEEESTDEESDDDDDDDEPKKRK